MLEIIILFYFNIIRKEISCCQSDAVSESVFTNGLCLLRKILKPELPEMFAYL